MKKKKENASGRNVDKNNELNKTTNISKKKASMRQISGHAK